MTPSPHAGHDGPHAAGAVILGSGLWHVLNRAGDGIHLKGGSPRRTPFGVSQPIFHAVFPGDAHALVLTRHGEKQYDRGAWNLNYRANLWALKDLGADTVLATSACGAIDPDLAVGHFLVPDDILDKTTGRAKTFFEHSGLGVLRHCDPFCPTLRTALNASLAGTGLPYRPRGVYVATDGPRLETPAEVRLFASQGAAVVGMTLAPEWALAREMELCYAAVCFVVNPAEGVRRRPWRPEVLFEGMATDEEAAAADRAAEHVPRLLGAALSALPSDRPCHCRKAMERYRRRGDIGEDFRTWV